MPAPFTRNLPLLLALAAAPVLADTVEQGWQAYENGDFATALTVFAPLAEDGDAAAQFYLARLYDTGRGVDVDPDRALAWYRRAAVQGHRAAQFIVGLRTARGEGTPADPAEAARWYQRAAEQGYPAAQLQLGVAYASGDGVTADPVRALGWWMLAADQGNRLAQANRDAMAAQLSPEQQAAATRLAGQLARRTTGRGTRP